LAVESIKPKTRPTLFLKSATNKI